MNFKNLKKIGINRFTIGTYLLNLFFHYVLRINSRFPYVIHFTNKVTSPLNIKLYGKGHLTEKCLLLNGGVYLGGANGIFIHKSCLIANSVKIISGNHNFKSYEAPSLKENPIRIEEGCWIGAGAIILPGVHLKKSTIVGAGSVVTKSFSENNITIAGNPAKKIKVRNE